MHTEQLSSRATPESSWESFLVFGFNQDEKQQGVRLGYLEKEDGIAFHITACALAATIAALILLPATVAAASPSTSSTIPPSGNSC